MTGGRQQDAQSPFSLKDIAVNRVKRRQQPYRKTAPGFEIGGIQMGSIIIPFLFLTFFSASACIQGQPRTLYKPADIENGRRNIEKYEWAKEIASERWEKKTSFARQQDREFFENFIPGLSLHSSYMSHCPACLKNPEKREVYGNNLKWDISRPEVLKCSQCGRVYPNADYPETGVLRATRMNQEFTYYQTPEERELPPDASPEERSKHALVYAGRPVTISFSGLIRFYKARWAIDQALRMAKHYAVTGDIPSAERVSWILDRFARVYPNYLWRNMDGSYVDLTPSEVAAQIAHPDFGPRGGGKFPPETIINAYIPYGGIHSDGQSEYVPMWQGFFGSGRLDRVDTGPLIKMTIAYDLVKDAVYPDGRRIIDKESARRIERDLIQQGCRDMEYWNDICNKSVATYVLSAAVGRLMEQPERIRRAIGGLNRIMEKRYHFDGFYTETPSYSMHNYQNMWMLPELLDGYSDPPGYQPAEGKRIENLEIFGRGQIGLAMLAMIRMLPPDYCLPNIGDTFYNSRLYSLFPEVLVKHYGNKYMGLLETLRGKGWGEEYSVWFRPHDIKADEKSELPLQSEWFPGWHVGVLRGGRPGDTALYMAGNEAYWTYGIAHRHRDILNLIYYAYGKEIVSDRGYFWGSPGVKTPDGKMLQYWTRSTLAHNLVVVDGSDQRGQFRTSLYGPIANGWPREWFQHPRAGAGSNLELFGTAPGIEVIQASGMGAYPQCEEYRRTIALINRPGGETYAVDFFRVKGGETHQYSFHCQGSLKKVEPANMNFQPAALSEEWTKWVSNVRGFKPEKPSVFTWNYGDINLDLSVLNTSDTVKQIIVVDAPGARRYNTEEFKKPPIQQVLVENNGVKGNKMLGTQYASVVVPYKSASSPVLSARLLVNNEETGVMAVEVKFKDRTDFIISTKDQQERTYGPVTLSGNFGFASLDNKEKVIQSYLLNGTLLESGETRLTLPEANTRAAVSGVSGSKITFAGTLAPELLTSAKYILAGGPLPEQEKREKGIPPLQTGYEIEKITEKSVAVRDYPVVACKEVTLLHSGWTNRKKWW